MNNLSQVNAVLPRESASAEPLVTLNTGAAAQMQSQLGGGRVMGDTVAIGGGTQVLRGGTSKLLGAVGGGDDASDVTGSVFAVMLQYQKMLNKEAREDRQTAREDGHPFEPIHRHRWGE
jgi:hypothetical protein